LQVYLRVFIPKTMADDVEGIASRLGSPVKQVTFPLDTTKRAQMTVRTPNHVVEQNRVELSGSPFVLNLVGNQQFFRKIGTNPLGQLRRKPAQHRMSCTILVRDPFRRWVQDIVVDDTIRNSRRQGPSWLRAKPCWLQEMKVNVLPSASSSANSLQKSTV
jgi:hypothetical protein